MSKKTVSIFWFRRDLRVEDNVGLFHALKSGYPVLPIFLFDKNILDALQDKADKRVSFIYEYLEKLRDQILNAGSSLFVLHDNPFDAFKTIIEKFNVKHVFANHDYEPYAIERDNKIGKLLELSGIGFQTSKDQVIFEKSEIMKGDGTPYQIYTPYSRAWKTQFRQDKIVAHASEKLLSNLFQTSAFHFPTLASIGFEKANFQFPSPDISKAVLKDYDKTRNFPAVAGTSRLGIHLRFGTISIRKLVLIAKNMNEQWLNELIWREFFMMILYHFPSVVTKSFKKEYDNIPWSYNEKEFHLWCKGETGYPIVDAGMRQLNETGFMHNRVRMITASFLTKHLLIDWRWGEAYFAEKLLDYELASNNGNWQWAAGSGCDAAPYFRIFNPTVQTKKFDPKLEYIKTWIKDFSSYHLRPMVEHEFARKRAIDVYQKALRNK